MSKIISISLYYNILKDKTLLDICRWVRYYLKGLRPVIKSKPYGTLYIVYELYRHRSACAIQTHISLLRGYTHIFQSVLVQSVLVDNSRAGHSTFYRQKYRFLWNFYLATFVIFMGYPSLRLPHDLSVRPSTDNLFSFSSAMVAENVKLSIVINLTILFKHTMWPCDLDLIPRPGDLDITLASHCHPREVRFEF